MPVDVIAVQSLGSRGIVFVAMHISYSGKSSHSQASSTSSTSGDRIAHLDALRGIAALGVCLHHALYSFHGIPGNEFIYRMAGESAVVFFFLLSSFVLCRSIDHASLKSPYSPNTIQAGKIGLTAIPPYYVKRFFRIYPAVLLAVLLSALIALFYREIPDLANSTAWFREQVMKARSVTGFQAYVMNALLLDRRLDPPLWTIIIELMGSFLLPWLMLLPRRRPLPLLTVAALFLCFAYRADGSTRYWLAPLFAFYIGYLIHLVEPFFRAPAEGKTKLLLALGITLWLFSIRHEFNYITESIILGAILMLLIPCNWPRLLILLKSRPFHFLGMISFSFYLINLPILLLSYVMLGHLMPKLLVIHPAILPALILFLLSIVVTVPIAALFRRFVELPFNSLGHQLARRFFPTT